MATHTIKPLKAFFSFMCSIPLIQVILMCLTSVLILPETGRLKQGKLTGNKKVWILIIDPLPR